jgi:hypothetical protein
VLSRDLCGYQELMFGASVRNAMLPYYVARKMRQRCLGNPGSDVSETAPARTSDTAVARRPRREAARTAPNSPTTRYWSGRLTTSMRRPDQR